MQIVSNKEKITKLLLQIVILLMLLTGFFCIFKPIQAYAEDDSSENMDLGGGSVQWSVDGESEGYVYIPGQIYWGGSETRTGLLFYCVDTESGEVKTDTINILYNSDLDQNGERWLPKVTARLGTTRVGNVNIYSISPTLDTSVPNTGSWDNIDGSPIKAWLEGDSGSTLPNGEPVCRAAYLVGQYVGMDAYQKVLNQEYTVCFEGMYGMAIYTRKDGLDVIRCNSKGIVQSLHPDVTDEEELAELSIIKYFTTLRTMTQVYSNLGIDITQRYGSNGTANFKWIQSCAKYFRTEEEHFGVPAASRTGSEATVDDIKGTGWNFAVIKVQVPPIHTYWEPNGTPGDTEPPSDDSGTSGPCVIRKLYYTEKIASDGTIIEEATDYHWFERSNTTAYISIDAEEGYEIDGWKASSANRSLRQKSDYAAVHPIIHSGDSAQEILLDKDNGEKYLYIIYKKTEIEENPPQEWDFRLEQSQITKRVTFLESSGPANTPSLITHNFTWTASAPSKTSCTSHGGNGHHLKHDKEWDVEPVEGVKR